MLACQLLPLLKKILTFMMTRTSGAGGSSISIHLNLYSFPGTLRKKKCGTMPKAMQKGQICFGKAVSCDLFKIELLEGDIDGLARSFTELLRIGYGWDKDEHGNTVLHVRMLFGLVAATSMSNWELASLTVHLGYTSRLEYARLKYFIEMCLAVSIDLYAPSKFGTYRLYLTFNFWCVYHAISLHYRISLTQ
jgi:hypothetical protein